MTPNRPSEDKALSKEDVLSENDIIKFDDYNPVYENIKKSMDEWARMQAIGFAEFIKQEMWIFSIKNEHKYYQTTVAEKIDYKTGEQLYTMFLEYQKSKL